VAARIAHGAKGREDWIANGAKGIEKRETKPRRGEGEDAK
jgi:hypothetical protein